MRHTRFAPRQLGCGPRARGVASSSSRPQRASMGRHADPTAPRRTAPLLLLIAAGVVVLLVAGGLVWWFAGPAEACETRETVAVTVAPELGTVTEELLADPIELDGGVCAE